MNQFDELFRKYNCNLVDEQVGKDVKELLASRFDSNNNTEVYKQCLSFIDLTSLNSTDTVPQIEAMTRKVNEFHQHFPALPNVGAICVYP